MGLSWEHKKGACIGACRRTCADGTGVALWLVSEEDLVCVQPECARQQQQESLLLVMTRGLTPGNWRKAAALTVWGTTE